MSTRQIKLGALTMGSGGPGRHNLWLDPQLPANASVDIDWYIDIARQAEAALFDLIFIVDSQFITQGSPSHYLSRLEPLTLLSALAVSTQRLGLVGTLTTSYNAPYNVARRLASLDLISKGRAGWNVVTSGDAGTAGNYGRDEHYDYDTRYARAKEHVEVVQGLWQSYEEQALPRNRQTGQFLDPARLHALHHRGEHFQVVGPLNIERSPQGQPVIFQAGDSEQGRELGAATADVIFTHAASIEQGQAFYRDVKTRAARLGRDPEQLLVLPGAEIYVGDTDEHAREIERHYHQADHSFELALKEFGRNFGWHDFSQYDLDAPFPQQSLEYARSSFFTNARRIAEQARVRNFSLRQAVEFGRQLRPGAFVGSAETVATKMTDWFEARALDGFNIYIGHPEQFRRFTQEVIPLLQARGVYRREYQGSTLREHLGLAIPRNRHGG
ncbi:LLM class flavin-dependent oxidoreductase [Pseudomonas cremoricolorata]|uniref:LLM class flavin-dependent oxidoreductase n=1 Tax=Pseudomonas cremoricolorata TaxID=157783 RepID=UPI00040F3708|nr:LLM class flavin-dependent oxidoreductase [Pseudomonas cremoricolorata]